MRITGLLFRVLDWKAPVFALLVLSCSTAASAEPASPSAKAEAFYRAVIAQDVDGLASVLHSSSLRGHRRYLEIALMKLRRIYGEVAVGALLGKSKGEIDALTDWEYFRLTVGIETELSQVQPKIDSILPKIVGEIDEGSTVYVVTKLKCSIEESGRRLNMEMPKVLTFKRESGEWRIDAFPFARSVATSYEEELALAAKATR